MTRFYVNDREINPPGGISSFDQILSYADKEQIPPNSVIRLISIDGNPLMQGEMSGDPQKIFSQISSCEKLEIITGTLQEIVRDSVSEALEYIDRVEEGISPLASMFQTDPGPEAFEGLRQLFEGFYWLNLLLDKLSGSFGVPLDEVILQGIPAQEHHRKFISILKQLQESQERRDMVLISDLLEYEIIPLIPVWRELFRLISVKVAVNP